MGVRVTVLSLSLLVLSQVIKWYIEMVEDACNIVRGSEVR
jgi:hypothetical protein